MAMLNIPAFTFNNNLNFCMFINRKVIYPSDFFSDVIFLAVFFNIAIFFIQNCGIMYDLINQSSTIKAKKIYIIKELVP